MEDVELLICEVDMDYRWNWLQFARERVPHVFLSLRDDRTFVGLRAAAGEVSLDGGPSPMQRMTVRRLAPVSGCDLARVTQSPVLEIRQYRIRPGQRARFAAFYRDRCIEPQTRCGIAVYDQFDNRDDENVFTFLRGFPDMVERDRRKNDFYRSPLWLNELQDEAFSMIEDYTNVLLVTPV
jgi:NIPSNAP